MVCGFCCVGIGWSGATHGLDQWAGNDDRAGVWVEQGSFQRTDRVKEDSRETACETQRGRPRQLRVQLRVWRERQNMMFISTSKNLWIWIEKWLTFPGYNIHHMKHFVLVWFKTYLSMHNHIMLLKTSITFYIGFVCWSFSASHLIYIPALSPVSEGAVQKEYN